MSIQLRSSIGQPDINIDALTNFIGYGCVDAPVVFIGIEESTGTYANRMQGLGIRSGFDPVMDLHEAHIAGIEHDPRLFGPAENVCQRTWRPMCDIMLRREGVNPSGFARNQYQANRLGRHDGESLLTELLPFPHPSTRDWWYGNLYPECKSRRQYEAFKLPHRISLLSEHLALHPRDLIVCYGKSHYDSYRAVIQQFRSQLNPNGPFDPIEWQVHPALGSSETAVVGHTRVILVNHFTRPPLSTNWALAPFAGLCAARLG